MVGQVDAKSYESSQVLIGHEHFIACAVQLPACPAHPSGAIVSGGYDRTMSGQTIVKPVINIWEAGSLVATLEGHTLTVCGIAVTPSGHLVSVSWDKTARVWDLSTRQCVTVMTGHEQAVWAVLCLEDGRMLTASADKTIKRWNGATCEHTYVGHSDCVRALAIMPGLGFLSTGNDCSIRMWAVSGECLMTMNGASAFLFHLVAPYSAQAPRCSALVPVDTPMILLVALSRTCFAPCSARAPRCSARVPVDTPMILLVALSRTCVICL